MSKKFGIVVIVISIVAIVFSVVTMSIVLPKLNKKEDVQFVLYLGTNDKDTNMPVFTQEEAKEKVKEILLDKLGGFTIQEANGGWKDGEKIYNEYTIVIYLSDTTIEDVHLICDKFIEVFRQSSILIQTNKTATEFYSGNNN